MSSSSPSRPQKKVKVDHPLQPSLVANEAGPSRRREDDVEPDVEGDQVGQKVPYFLFKLLPPHQRELLSGAGCDEAIQAASDFGYPPPNAAHERVKVVKGYEDPYPATTEGTYDYKARVFSDQFTGGTDDVEAFERATRAGRPADKVEELKEIKRREEKEMKDLYVKTDASLVTMAAAAAHAEGITNVPIDEVVEGVSTLENHYEAAKAVGAEILLFDVIPATFDGNSGINALLPWRRQGRSRAWTKTALACSQRWLFALWTCLGQILTSCSPKYMPLVLGMMFKLILSDSTLELLLFYNLLIGRYTRAYIRRLIDGKASTLSVSLLLPTHIGGLKLWFVPVNSILSFSNAYNLCALLVRGSVKSSGPSYFQQLLRGRETDLVDADLRTKADELIDASDHVSYTRTEEEKLKAEFEAYEEDRAVQASFVAASKKAREATRLKAIEAGTEGMWRDGMTWAERYARVDEVAKQTAQEKPAKRSRRMSSHAFGGDMTTLPSRRKK